MRNDKLFTFCNLYILLWLIYSLQSFVFGGKGTIFSSIIIFSLIGISAYHFVYALSNYEMPKYMKGLTVLVIMFTIYGIILILSGKTIRFMSSGAVANKVSYLKSILISLLPVFSFYVFTRKGLLTKEVLLKWTPIFFIVAGMRYFQYRQEVLARSAEEVEEITNNLGYVFLSLIPLLAFWSHKRFVQYFWLALSMLFIILGMKRGAILIGAVSFVLFLHQSLKSASQKQKIWTFFLGFVLIIGAIFMVSYMLQNSAYFNERLEYTLEGNSSGRDRLYGTFWRHFINESNPFLFLFGNGALGTLTISFNYAHNDWLEIAINQGLLGILVYVYYWMMFYKTWKKSAFDSEIYLATGLVLLIFFMKTLFSMSYNDMDVYVTLSLGYCMGMISENENMVDTESEDENMVDTEYPLGLEQSTDFNENT